MSFRLVLLTTFVTFCAFYAPQPLLPLFTRNFGVSATLAALLISMTFIVLCLAPVLIGALLQRYSARKMMILATALLGMCQFLFAAGDTFTVLLASRALQSFLFPVVFTAAVTYCSQAGARHTLPGRVSTYIATTILGGLGGRLFAGFLSDWFNWQLPFFLLGAGLLLCSLILFFVVKEPYANTTQTEMKSAELLRLPSFFFGFALIFTTFFSFSALLNALPFRLAELDPDIPAFTISLVYLGYMAGVILAVNGGAIANMLGGPLSSLKTALLLFVTGLLFFFSLDAHWLIGFSFISAGGFFMLHATLSSFLNNLQPHLAGLVNGYYIAIYYAAGAAGSLLPVWLYSKFGWTVFMVLLISVSSLGFYSLRRMNAGAAKATDA